MNIKMRKQYEYVGIQLWVKSNQLNHNMCVGGGVWKA